MRMHTVRISRPAFWGEADDNRAARAAGCHLVARVRVYRHDVALTRTQALRDTPLHSYPTRLSHKRAGQRKGNMIE